MDLMKRKEKSKSSSIMQAPLQSANNFDKSEDKKELSRKSAKNTRKRKKIYIELLEKKVKQLQNELQNLENQNQIKQDSIKGQ